MPHRSALRAALAAVLCFAVLAVPAVSSAAPAAGPDANASRCSIYDQIPVERAKERMNGIEGSIRYAKQQIKKFKKQIKNAKTDKAKKRAKKKLKAAKADLKALRKDLPDAKRDFQEANQKAVAEGCPPDDGKPNRRRR